MGLGALVLIAGSALAQSASVPFVTVNGEGQSVLMAEILLNEQISRGVANTPELQAAVRNIIVQKAAMAQEAVKAGLERQPAVQAQMALARQNILAQAWQQQVLQGIQLQEADLAAEYQRQTRLLGPREYRVRHLLVQEEATAKLLIDKLKAGTRMAELAAEYSRDETTRQQGGLTEWTPQGQLLPAIAKAVAEMRPGQLFTAPVATPAGWHVVQLEDSRDYKPPSMDSVKNQLVQAVLQQRLNEAVEQLRSRTKVE